MTTNTMQIESFGFEVKTATFRYVPDNWSGAGWDFSFHAVPLGEKADDMFPGGVILRAEAAPLPLQPATDLTGVEFFASLPYDEESGEPLFGLVIDEEHEVTELRLKFRERDGNSYLIEIEAKVAETVLEEQAPLNLRAWAVQQSSHAYPT